MAIKIPLGKSGMFALVDELDAETVLKHTWVASKTDGIYYARNMTGTKSFPMHRFILKPAENEVVDHINGNGLDNRRCNIRKCTHSQNNWNLTRKNKLNTSGVTGVCWNKSKKRWLARIKVHSASKYIGQFKTLEAATIARRKAELQYYGDFAPKQITG